MIIPAGLKLIASYLPRPLYLVGGYVRDFLIGYVPHDADIAGDMSPDEIFSCLDGKCVVKETSKKLMTLKIIVGSEEYEYTAFRTDSYTTGHSPAEVKRTDDIKLDAMRRDFTVNAIYCDVSTGKIIDPLNGTEDLKNKTYVATRSTTFSEDGLRLMRLCRQAAETGFDIDKDTLEQAKKNASLIKDISPERIREELDRILIADTRYGVKDAQERGLRLLDKIGVLDYILPEITLGKGMPQRPDFHKYDVFDHIIETVKYSDPSVRLAALFHDCAKPYCKIKTGLYRGHEVEGERLCADIMHRLRYPNDVIKETKALVLYHMYDLKNEAKENTIRKFVQAHYEIIDKLILLKQADYLGCGLCEGISPGAKRLSDTLSQLKEEKVPFRISDLLINGHDLEDMGVPEEKRGTILKNLLSECAVIDTPYLTREAQLNYIKRHL